jgi:hypothetical protein
LPTAVHLEILSVAFSLDARDRRVAPAGGGNPAEPVAVNVVPGARGGETPAGFGTAAVVAEPVPKISETAFITVCTGADGAVATAAAAVEAVNTPFEKP